jgi:(p)ppGpp synthase/HD superfamily hydrolase
MAYSEYQEKLFERIQRMRDDFEMTYDAIAEALNAEGVKSPRGVTLMAEHVFSIYRKGVRRQMRFVATPLIILENFNIR